MNDLGLGKVLGKQQIIVVFGTRPEAIKLFPVIHALRREAEIETRVCVTAKHSDLPDQVLEIAGIGPDIDLEVMQGDTAPDGLQSEERRIGEGGFNAGKK